MNNFRAIFKRELWSHFTSPPVYALLIIYLLLSGIMTFTLGGFIDSNSADLNGFFIWQPWLLLFFASALGMGQWAEEYRTGTAELLLTLPLTPCTAALGKFCAVWSVLTLGIFLTFPLAVTCFVLGSPDPGPMACGYLGCWLAAGFFAALSQAASVISHSQFVGFLLSFVLGLGTLLTGFLPCNLLLWKWGVSPAVIDAVSAVSLTSHFDEMCKGTLALRGPFIFLGGTAVLLSFAVWRLNCRHQRRRRTLPAMLWILLPLLCFPAVEKLPWKLDCTADRLHTLDEGTIDILKNAPEGTRIRYCFSWSYPEISRALRDYAVDVDQMLRDMARKSDGRIILERIDPISPEAQAQAEEEGLTPQVGSLGDLWFFGISISHRDNGKVHAAIPLLRPEESHTLEYRLATMLLPDDGKRSIGVISTLPVTERVNPETRKLSPAWHSIQRLGKNAQLLPITADNLHLLPQLDLLLMIHPHSMPPEMEKAVLDFNAGGKPVILAVDTLSRADAQFRGRYALPTPSDFPALLSAYGLEMSNKVIADRKFAASMADTTRGVEIYPTLLTVTGEELSSASPVTRHLSKVTFFCADALKCSELPGVKVTPLVSSSPESRLLESYEAQRSPADIMTDFKPDGLPRTIAALAENGTGSIAVIADVDWLHNSLCINDTTDQSGQRRVVPISDNADFLANLSDYLCADRRLLKVRSKGRTRHTFTAIEALGRAAEAEIQELGNEAFRQAEPLRRQLHELELLASSLAPEEYSRRMDELEKNDAAMQRVLKSRQRQVLRKLRGQLDAIERKAALACIGMMPALLLIISLAVARRRR